jgi:aspartyl-tRNA(Asn)/glutamyl-tRNA(Gln) amidotransferase subunit C
LAGVEQKAKKVRLCMIIYLSFYPYTLKNYICKMEVNDALVSKLSHLAKLDFNTAEKEEIKNDLQRMISFVEKLNELDTTGVEPLLHMSDEVNILREDEVKGSITRKEALKNAPQHDEQFFKVPKVIKTPKENKE